MYVSINISAYVGSAWFSTMFMTQLLSDFQNNIIYWSFYNEICVFNIRFSWNFKQDKVSLWSADKSIESSAEVCWWRRWKMQKDWGAFVGGGSRPRATHALLKTCTEALSESFPKMSWCLFPLNGLLTKFLPITFTEAELNIPTAGRSQFGL